MRLGKGLEGLGMPKVIASRQGIGGKVRLDKGSGASAGAFEGSRQNSDIPFGSTVSSP